jgi:hypothetical protein
MAITTYNFVLSMVSFRTTGDYFGSSFQKKQRVEVLSKSRDSQGELSQPYENKLDVIIYYASPSACINPVEKKGAGVLSATSQLL